VIWEPFLLALVLGLIVSAGLYFAYLWPSVEPLEEGAVAAEAEPAAPAATAPVAPASPAPAEAAASPSATPAATPDEAASS
jgi:hypothetical protein